jgi:hypothetical protein
MRQLAAPFDSYDGLIGVIRHRLAELGATCEAASALAGLTETHISKIVCPARVRVLGRMSLSVVLQVLGIRLIAVTDDAAYAPLAKRLPAARFNRWKPRETRVRVDDVGGVAAVEKLPALYAAVAVPIAEPKPKPPSAAAIAKSSSVAKTSPTVTLRPKIPPRGFPPGLTQGFGRGHRKASRPSASAAV